jgi:hypothetical protein
MGLIPGRRSPASKAPLRRRDLTFGYSCRSLVAIDSPLRRLITFIVDGDDAAALRTLAASPALATAREAKGATRQSPEASFFEEIKHYVYEGDTALHLAAAAYRKAVARKLVAAGADVNAKNRRGAGPLHYAVDGVPGSPSWNPRAQAATVTFLLEAGADPNAADAGGVTPLHRAVRNRCAAAVAALLQGGADPRRRNKKGTTVRQLAELTTGRGGVGSPEAKAQQEEIVRLLDRAGATP